jgi:hypothetical protein
MARKLMLASLAARALDLQKPGAAIVRHHKQVREPGNLTIHALGNGHAGAGGYVAVICPAVRDMHDAVARGA